MQAVDGFLSEVKEFVVDMLGLNIMVHSGNLIELLKSKY